MPTKTRASSIDHAAHLAHTWINEVARQFGTDDKEFAYDVMRAWLHTLRDRLTVGASAHFAAQLPDLIRGVFYAGWDPNSVPVKYDAGGYSMRFARDANISIQDVPKAATAVTAAAARLLSAEHIDKSLGHVPSDIRALLQQEPESDVS